jgi:phytanoyl-CoA hydroxylase
MSALFSLPLAPSSFPTPTPQQGYLPSSDDIASYRENGFVILRNVFSPSEVSRFRDGITAAIRGKRGRFFSANDALEQSVNLWEFDDEARALTLHPHIVSAARALAGVPLRLWHDQALIKHPGGKPTVYHQGQPNWGHVCRPDSHALTAWIALTDATLDHGCMGFIPGSHRRGSLGKQHAMTSARGLFDIAPDCEWATNVRIPLRAGDVSFHHAYTVHMAGANNTNEARIGHIVDFIDRDTVTDGHYHAVTDDLKLPAGSPIAGERFPDVGYP